MKRFSIVAACCAIALAVAAPAASGTTVRDSHRTCTADARWQLSLDALGFGHADITYSNIVCEGRFASFESEGAVLAAGPTPPEPSEGVLRVQLAGLVTAAGTYSGSVTQDEIGMRGVVAANSTDLNASLETVHTSDDGTTLVRTAVHQSVGSCGSFCYDVKVRNVISEEHVS